MDEESGLRGYETTGDTRFLQPFYEAEPHLQNEIQNLDNMAGADADQKHDIADLRDEHQTWEDGFALPIIATVRGGGQTNDVDLNLHGKVLMDNVRHDLTDIIQKAEASRARRIALWHRQVHSLLLALLVLALGMGVLIGLFTRSRLHAVSSAYRGSLDVLGRRAEEILPIRAATPHDSRLHRRRSHHLRCRRPHPDDESRRARSSPAGARPKPMDDRLEEIFRIVNEATREPVETPVAKVKRLNKIVGMANHTPFCIRKDGTELDIADSGAPIRDRRRRHSRHRPGLSRHHPGTPNTGDPASRTRSWPSQVASPPPSPTKSIIRSTPSPICSISCATARLQRNPVQFMDMAEQELARVTQISRAMLGLYRESRAPVPVDLKGMLEEILLLMESTASASSGSPLNRDFPIG